MGELYALSPFNPISFVKSVLGGGVFSSGHRWGILGGHQGDGKTVSLNDFRGKVVLLNIWATWCPPCVEEIPSLNRLKQEMQGNKFQLISINYAESPQHIREFMRKVAVDFPVLVDPDGKLSAQWKVVAFPSTFVIGPDGNIHYGVNAAIHWDAPEVVQQLNQLAEKH